jgi:hypothetical protein
LLPLPLFVIGASIIVFALQRKHALIASTRQHHSGPCAWGIAVPVVT